MLINLDKFFSSLSSVLYNDNGLTIFGLAFLLEICFFVIYLIFRIVFDLIKQKEEN